MPEFAQFVAPIGSDNPVPSGQLFRFDLPDLNSERTVILMFKVSGPSNAHVQMTLNAAGGSDEQVIDFHLDSTFTRPRSWHEITEGSRYRVADNHLIFEAGSPATVSDIVVLYHAKTP